jgi:hypothetical protein
MKKRPAIRDWPAFDPTDAEIAQYFGPNSNVGLLTSNGLTDVDLDVPEAIKLAPQILLDTRWRHGRAGALSSHYFYMSPGCTTRKFADPIDGTMLVELRADGCQTLVPPSVHPSGEQVVQEREGEPSCVPCDELSEGVRCLAAATILTRYYPSRGNRHHWTNALIGALLRGGWSEQDIIHFINAICLAANDEEWLQREGNIATTIRRLNGGEPASGAPSLAAVMPEQAVWTAFAWLKFEWAEQRSNFVSVGSSYEDAPVERDASLEFPEGAFRGSFERFRTFLRPITGASPAHAFAAWWAVLGSCIGRNRWGTWSGRVLPVVYATLIGPTGDHKSSAMDNAAELLPESLLRIDGATSDAGMFDALHDAHGGPALFHFDELGFLLKMSSLSGSTLDAMFNRLWGAPRYLDRNLSGRGREGAGRRRISEPFACLLAGTHPETFWRTIGDPTLAIAGGFVNRLAFFYVENGRSLPRTESPDEALALDLREHLEKLTRMESEVVELSTAAEPTWISFSSSHDARLRDLPVDEAACVKRVRDHVARLALTYAVDAGRTVVEPDDLLPAIEVGGFLTESYRRLLLARQPDWGPVRTSQLEKNVRRLLEKRPKTWHSVRDLQRAWPNAVAPAAKELRAVIDAMDDVERDRPAGSRSNHYRLLVRHPTDK